MNRRIISLNTSDEAFDLFQRLLTPVVVDVRGETVRIDIGDYVHLMDDEERVQRIRWIRETLVNPLEIRRSHLKSEPFGEVYINTIYEDEGDLQGRPFVVGVERRAGVLDFRTAFVPHPQYLQKAKKGKLIWKAKS